MLGTTDIGFMNKNRQRVVEKTTHTSNHFNQRLYRLECGDCGTSYLAKGSDIWLRKGPKCMGGQPSSEARQ